jgi:hypothetical protein
MNDNPEAARLWIAIEDHLIPFLKLDAHERSLYYHLVRHSRLIGQRSTRVSMESLAKRTGFSQTVRTWLRSLEAKGCVKILDRNRDGTYVEVFVPSEIPGCEPPAATAQPIDLDSFDFYTDPRGRVAILARDGNRCFYCLRAIDGASAVLDHAMPQAQRLDNTYRNIVACCHECNSLKAGAVADDFLRLLYRRGRLSATELEARLLAVAALERGDLKPVAVGHDL